MPSYSTHDDLKQLHENIDELTSKISDFRFYGTGPNDMLPIITAERNVVDISDVVGFWIQLQAVGMTVNKIRWSDRGHPADWVGENVIITADVQHLNHGAAINFTEAFGHVLDDYWRFNLNPPDSSEERTMAYNWVNDRLKQHISTPLTDPSQTIVLAEANFAISLILRSKNREGFDDFRDEATRLIEEMVEVPLTTPEAITEQPVE